VPIIFVISGQASTGWPDPNLPSVNLLLVCQNKRWIGACQRKIWRGLQAQR